MYCGRCGCKCSPQGQFCPRCGAQIIKQTKRRGVSLWVIAAICVVVIIGAAVAGILHVSRDVSDVEVTGAGRDHSAVVSEVEVSGTAVPVTESGEVAAPVVEAVPTVERETVDPEIIQSMANDVAARSLAYMFTHKGSEILSAYEYDFDFDGNDDLIMELSTLTVPHDFTLLVPADGSSRVYTVTDMSAAGGVDLYVSYATQDIVMRKFYGSAGYAMELYRPLFGETFAEVKRETNMELVDFYTYQVDGRETTKAEFDAKLESMDLQPMESEIATPETAFAVVFELPGDQIEYLLDAVGDMSFITEYHKRDINGDGAPDAMLIAEVHEGQPFGVEAINEYGPYEPAQTHEWSECGILIQSTEKGVSVRVSEANWIRQLMGYRESMAEVEQWVTDGYYGVVRENGVSAGGTVKEYHVPQINITSEEADRINAEIMDICKDDIAVCRDSSDQSDNYEIYEVDYEWMVNGDILSVLLWRRSMYEYVYYYTFNVSLSTGEPVSQETVLEACGYTEEEYRAQAKLAMGSEFWNFMGPDAVYECNKFLQSTISEENIDAAQPYINEDGDLCIACIVYVPAGGGKSPKCINLETFVVPYYYAEEIKAP